MSIQNFDLTLRLRWGYDAARQITIPVEIRKGSYSGRYELYIDGTHIGWVVRYDGETARRSYTAWNSYLSAEQNGGYQRQTSFNETTRFEAIYDLIGRLADHARTNVLASRAAVAYADA